MNTGPDSFQPSNLHRHPASEPLYRCFERLGLACQHHAAFKDLCKSIGLEISIWLGNQMLYSEPPLDRQKAGDDDGITSYRIIMRASSICFASNRRKSPLSFPRTRVCTNHLPATCMALCSCLPSADQ